jgi:hypothetical protein
MMPTEDLDAVIRAALAIELPQAPLSARDRLVRVLVARIETRDAQLAAAYAQLAAAYGPGARRTRRELLEALGVERALPIPPRRPPRDTPEERAERVALLERDFAEPPEPPSAGHP